MHTKDSQSSLYLAAVAAVAASMLPVSLVRVRPGVILQRRVSPARFFQIANLMLLLWGSKLLYDGVRGLLG